MHHLLREDSRGMLSIPQALWLHERAAPARTPPRHRIAAALLALATWLAPSVTRGRQGQPAAIRAA